MLFFKEDSDLNAKKIVRLSIHFEPDDFGYLLHSKSVVMASYPLYGYRNETMALQLNFCTESFSKLLLHSILVCGVKIHAYTFTAMATYSNVHRPKCN